MHSTRELLLESHACASTTQRTVRFSPRGREVMELFMRGFTYKEIAEQLSMSRSGVSRHREKMLWQNDCKSMLELIAKYRVWLAEQQVQQGEIDGLDSKMKHRASVYGNGKHNS